MWYCGYCLKGHKELKKAFNCCDKAEYVYNWKRKKEAQPYSLPVSL